MYIPEITCYHVAKHGVVCLTKSQGVPEVLSSTGIRHVCICPFFTETNIITEDPEMFKAVKDYVGVSNIMTVDKVGAAFIDLIKDGYNGAAICIMPKMEPFYWPFYLEKIVFLWLMVGTWVSSKLFKIKNFGPWHQLVYFVFSIVFLNFLLRLVLGMLF